MATTTNDEVIPTAAHAESFNNHGMSTTTKLVINEWIIHTVAMDHMTNDPSKLELKTRPKQNMVKTANRV